MNLTVICGDGGIESFQGPLIWELLVDKLHCVKGGAIQLINLASQDLQGG